MLLLLVSVNVKHPVKVVLILLVRSSLPTGLLPRKDKEKIERQRSLMRKVRLEMKEVWWVRVGGCC